MPSANFSTIIEKKNKHKIIFDFTSQSKDSYILQQINSIIFEVERI